MDPISWSDIDIEGELAVRSGLSFARLEGKWYRPDEVFTADTHGWPGDWEGRLILGLTLLARATHRTPAYLEEIIDELPAHLNGKGYLGPIRPDGVSDEQQLSGHSWLLRGLIEHYEWKRNPAIKSMIETILRNLFLKTRGCYRKYPLDDGARKLSGDWILSRLQTKTKAHAETSDCGCAFMPIDGVSHAYQLLGWPELRALADEMIDVFLSLDLVALRVQTHATLSAIRGMIRMYEITGDRRYLTAAADRFGFYKTNAWTAAFGNYNWFGHPRWTEPCGIIDSFMAAVGLWRHTGDHRFLEDAHRIYYNALSHGHRANGSFGTDRCAGARDADHARFITPVNFETYWCCTMRGGEGFARAIEYCYFVDDNALTVPFYHNSMAIVRFADGEATVRQKTGYPYDGAVRLTLCGSALRSRKKLRLFAPSWSDHEGITARIDGRPASASRENGFLLLDVPPRAESTIDIDLGLSLYAVEVSGETLVEGCHAFTFGPMVLGYKPQATKGGVEEDIGAEGTDRKLIDFGYRIPEPIRLDRDAAFDALGRGRFKCRRTGIVISPLCDVHDMTREDSIGQILFS